MREIKFRAWDSLNRGWIHYEMTRGRITVFEDVVGAEMSDWQQFTGLKDFDGKEIYEGDIVRNILTRYTKIMEWKSGYIHHGEEYISGFHVPGDEPEDLEVIGNIYENPELVSKE